MFSSKIFSFIGQYVFLEDIFLYWSVCFPRRYFSLSVSVFSNLAHYIPGKLSSAALLLPGRHAINASLLAANIGCMGYFFNAPSLAAGTYILCEIM